MGLVMATLGELYAMFNHGSPVMKAVDSKTIDAMKISPLDGLATSTTKRNITNASTAVGPTEKVTDQEERIAMYRNFAYEMPFHGLLGCFSIDAQSCKGSPNSTTHRIDTAKVAINRDDISALLKQMPFPSLSSVTKIPPRYQPWMQHSRKC